MSDLGFAEAFAEYGAHLKNVQWSVCAEALDGSLVVSCWVHLFGMSHDGIIPYTDDLNRWQGNGNKELRERLAHAFASGQTIRVVFAKTDDIEAVNSGTDTSKIKKMVLIT
jgi:hypothetical protein